MPPTKKRKLLIAKSGSEWTMTELEFFQINIVPENNFYTFFGNNPCEDFSENILQIINSDLYNPDVYEKTDWNTVEPKEFSRFIKNVLAVTKTHINMESVVDDFAKTLFEILDFDTGDICIHTKEKLQLEMCNKITYAKPDVCVETFLTTIKLLVQEDKSFKNDKITANAEAQVIAEAIAAFQVNKKIYEKLGKETKVEQLIPCITMHGTYPTFYLFNVTEDLANAVKTGTKPKSKTIIKRYKISMHTVNIGDAMLIKEHRQHIMQCYIALRQLVLQK